ncbi:uncharacterized protein LOC119731320 [Patiria miniata]|uniref:Uncharacterized protein n=1 Tax=Patiria miniata TaxID=46514 RepID=A0A914AAI8_PATMI|nr:uncharacterized protein LOC119731320 [Patiria miniata]
MISSCQYKNVSTSFYPTAAIGYVSLTSAVSEVSTSDCLACLDVKQLFWFSMSETCCISSGRTVKLGTGVSEAMLCTMDTIPTEPSSCPNLGSLLAQKTLNSWNA